MRRISVRRFSICVRSNLPPGSESCDPGSLCPSSDAFQHRLEVLPEALDRRNLDALVGAVGIDDGWAERDHLHAGIFFADHAALQARVHGNQFGGLAEELLVHRLELAHDFASGLGLPSGIAAAMLDFRSEEHTSEL